MKRLGSLLARAIVLALLLLSISGGIANAGSPFGGKVPNSLPDDPGYTLAP